MVDAMKVSGLLLGCALALTAVNSPAMAAETSTPPTARQLELAHRFIEVIHIDKTYADTMRSMGPTILASMPNGDGSDPALRQKVLEVVNEAASDLMGTLIQKMEPIMAEIYTEEELTDIVAFYESKSGRAMIEKQPLMAAKLAPLMKDIMPQFQTNLRAKVCAKVDCKALAARK